MKPKYTTEALRVELRKIVTRNGTAGRIPEVLELELDKLVSLFAQQQELLDEVEERLPEKEDYLTAPGSTEKEIEIWNKAIDRVTETLEAIRKERV